jgi:hypothetical protein
MLRALTLLIALALPSPALAEDSVVKASDDSSLQLLSRVFSIHNLSDDKNGVKVRLFESGGGDPALNGNRLMLAVVPDPALEPRVWRTGIDIYSVRGVALDAEKSEISIDVTEHFQDDHGPIRERPRSYTIRYDVDAESGAVSEAIQVHAGPT